MPAPTVFTKISELDELAEAPADADEFLVNDNSTLETKRVSQTNTRKGILGGDLTITTAAPSVLLANSVAAGLLQLQGNKTTQAGAAVILGNANALNHTAGSSIQGIARVEGTINQTSGAGGYTLLEAAAIETSVASTGPKKLIRALAGAGGTTEKFFVDNKGAVMSAAWKTKAADQHRNTTTVLATDAELFVDVVAGGVYAFRAKVFVSEDGAVAGLKIAMGGTATATAFRATATVIADDGSLVFFRLETSLDDSGAGTALGAGDFIADLEGSVTINADGTFGVRHAQAVSDGDDTDVLAQSTLLVERTG